MEFGAAAAGFGKETEHRSEALSSGSWRARPADRSAAPTSPSAPRDRETVDAFHAAALAAGGTDNGAPGPRPIYHPGYYGAFVLDPDGNNVEAVCHIAA